MGATDRYKEEVIDPGDRVSRLAKGVNIASYPNCKAVCVVDKNKGNFRGPVGYVWRPHILARMAESFDAKGVPTGEWPMTEAVENDGAGGKPMFFTVAGTKSAFAQLGWEIIAMTADDLARTGRFPAVMVNEACFKGVTRENLPLVEAMFEGFGRALKRARLVSITGETAIMHYQITSLFNFHWPSQLILTWGGTCIGLRDSKLYFDGSTIGPGMAVVGFWEPGYRCNGGTFLARILMAKWGINPPMIKRNPEARAFIQQLTVPSLSYARTLCRLAGWQPDGSTGEPLADIRGVAHITGGGLWGKFGELLPAGVGATLMSMPRPAEVLLTAQQLSVGTELELSDWRAYSTFHGGCGMLVVVPGEHVDLVIREADRDHITALKVGETTSCDKREILVRSRFGLTPGKTLFSLHPE